MTLVLLLGGARSGKSSLAVLLAQRQGLPVTVVATGEGRDPEMRERIDLHRRERPSSWTTLEVPLDLRGALGGMPPTRTAIVDCLTLWVANEMERGTKDDRVLEMARESAKLAKQRRGLTLVVSNEVGMGLVPAVPLGRRYRDVLGSVNRIWASLADEALLVVAGRTIPLSVALPRVSRPVGPIRDRRTERRPGSGEQGRRASAGASGDGPG